MSFLDEIKMVDYLNFQNLKNKYRKSFENNKQFLSKITNSTFFS